MMQKKVLSLFLAFCLVFVMVPSMAFATDDGTNSEAQAMVETPAPAEEISAPAEEPADSTEELAASAEEPADPAEESAAPAEDPADLVEEPAAPVEEPADPVEEPADSVEESAAPAEESAAPVEEPADLAEEELTEESSSLSDEDLAEDPETEPVADEPQSDAAPYIQTLSFTANGKTYSENVDENGYMYLEIPGDVKLNDCTVTLVTSAPVDFVKSETKTKGNLFVFDASGKTADISFNVEVSGIDLGTGLGSIHLETADYITWTGKSSLSSVGGVSIPEIPLSTLIDSLAQYSATGLEAGAMKLRNSAATSSTFQPLLCNQDSQNVVLAYCKDNVSVYTVTFVCGGATYTWKLPAGAPLQTPTPILQSGQTVTGWYLGEADDAAPAPATVTGDMTIYAHITGGVATTTFEQALQKGETILPIKTLDDWTAFTTRSSEVKATQRVVLEDDITCSGIYPALTFAGSFDGQNHTIKGATFKSSGDNSGMFASIGKGQIIANVILQDITVQSAENAGALAGSASNAAIQNVQVRNGTINGRNVGGIVGSLFVTTAKFCSSRGTTIKGIVNAGGITGISYGTMSNCYSADCAISAWIRSGGIGGACPEATTVEYCWCTQSKIAGQWGSSDMHELNTLVNVNSNTKVDDFTGKKFNKRFWNLQDGTATDFTSHVNYGF